MKKSWMQSQVILQYSWQTTHSNWSHILGKKRCVLSAGNYGKSDDNSNCGTQCAEQMKLKVWHDPWTERNGLSLLPSDVSLQRTWHLLRQQVPTPRVQHSIAVCWSCGSFTVSCRFLPFSTGVHVLQTLIRARTLHCRRGTLLWHLSILVTYDWTAQ